jgi:hypothetical protein
VASAAAGGGGAPRLCDRAFFFAITQLLVTFADNSHMNGTDTPWPGRRGTRLALWGGALTLLVIVAGVAWHARSTVRVGDAGSLGSPGGGGSVPGAPATAGSPSMGGALRERAVAAAVAEGNRAGEQQAEAFHRAGWTLVATAPPDARLVALDPELLPAREAELRQQIASTVAAPTATPRLLQIAKSAREPATRVAAVDALGRIGTPEAQVALAQLLVELPPEDEARRQIVPLLRPRALDEPGAARLAGMLDSPSLTAVEKEQLAFTLALLRLRDGVGLPEGATSASGQALIDRMAVLAQRGSAVH